MPQDSMKRKTTRKKQPISLSLARGRKPWMLVVSAWRLKRSQRESFRGRSSRARWDRRTFSSVRDDGSRGEEDGESQENHLPFSRGDAAAAAEGDLPEDGESIEDVVGALRRPASPEATEAQDER